MCHQAHEVRGLHLGLQSVFSPCVRRTWGLKRPNPAIEPIGEGGHPGVPLGCASAIYYVKCGSPLTMGPFAKGAGPGSQR